MLVVLGEILRNGVAGSFGIYMVFITIAMCFTWCVYCFEAEPGWGEMQFSSVTITRHGWHYHSFLLSKICSSHSGDSIDWFKLVFP